MDDDEGYAAPRAILLTDEGVQQFLRIRIGDGMDTLMEKWGRREKIADSVVRSAIVHHAPFRDPFDPGEKKACIRAGYEFLERRGFAYNPDDNCWYPKGIKTYN